MFDTMTSSSTDFSFVLHSLDHPIPVVPDLVSLKFRFVSTLGRPRLKLRLKKIFENE